MKEKKNNKVIFIIVGIILLIVIITTIIIAIAKNKMTPEETLSRFMYLVENKNYEEAKKLCYEDLEQLDVLANIKPSNLTFDFSQDKKNAKAVILEDEIESTDIKVTLRETLLGWKVESYKVATGLIEAQIIEDRIKQNKTISDIQLLYWGESDVANKEEIAEYAKDNAMVAIIFTETMKAKKYDKANELYDVISEQDLTIDNLKEYDWNNYEMISNFKILEGPEGDFNCITVKLDEKKILFYIAGKQIISIKESTI